MMLLFRRSLFNEIDINSGYHQSASINKHVSFHKIKNKLKKKHGTTDHVDANSRRDLLFR